MLSGITLAALYEPVAAVVVMLLITAAWVSMVVLKVVEATLTLPAKSVWMARTLYTPSARLRLSSVATVPFRVARPRLSPASSTPSALVSLKNSTLEPATTVAVKVKPELMRVMSSAVV